MVEAEGSKRTKVKVNHCQKEYLFSYITCGCTLASFFKKENLHVICIKMQLFMKSELFKGTNFFAADDSCTSFSITFFLSEEAPAPTDVCTRHWRQAL